MEVDLTYLGFQQVEAGEDLKAREIKVFECSGLFIDVRDMKILSAVYYGSNGFKKIIFIDNIKDVENIIKYLDL